MKPKDFRNDSKNIDIPRPSNIRPMPKPQKIEQPQVKPPNKPKK